MNLFDFTMMAGGVFFGSSAIQLVKAAFGF